MLAIYNFVPSYCPNCGQAIDLKGYGGDGYEPGSRYRKDADYRAGCSHYCPKCNLGYQYANRQNILDAAEASGGDMKQYY